ncbi:MAG: amidohydrolase family protein [Planctomycetes bacterium]|nr:amidohydrolase family protein [Planctomycetota bacterium]
MAPHLFRVGSLLVDRDRWISSATVAVRRGRIVGLAAGDAAGRRLARKAGGAVADLGPGVLAPGWVDAHAHLELGALHGRLPARAFGAWVGQLVKARAACSREELRAGLRADADRLLAGGTTAVGDNDALGLAAGLLRRHPLRARVFREALDAGDPARTSAVLRRVQPGRPAPRLAFGVAPHAPFTVSPTLARRLATLARRRRLPLSIHFAESRDERQWLLRGTGPLARLMPGESPRREGLELLEEAGLLGRRTLLVHANLPGPGDRERIQRAGATVVHCPGSHRWFRRPAFDLAGWLEAGVPVALGTDSSASNAELDMGREVALAAEAHPAVDVAVLLDCATRAGAEALGLGTGRLTEGAPLDAYLTEARVRSRRAALELLVRGRPGIRAVLIGGERAWDDGSQVVPAILRP